MNTMKEKICYCFSSISLVLTCSFPVSLDAKTLYVNSLTGNDSVSYDANSETSPWRTIGRAAWGNSNYGTPNVTQAAQAGDTVLIAAGTYWEGTGGNTTAAGSRFIVTLNPANSGTSENPITFQGVGDVYVRTVNTVRGPLIGCATRNYVTWNHFIIDDYYAGSARDTGPVVFFNSAGCKLLNSEVIGHRGSYYFGYNIFDANYTGIRMEQANFITIRNNRIHDFPGAAAGVQTYDTNDSIIENNESYNIEICIYLKGQHVTSQSRNIVRYNYVHNCTRGIQAEYTQDTLIYQNVSANNRNAGLYAGAFYPTRPRFINNTVYGSGIGSVYLIETMMTGVEFLNNIFSNSPAGYYSWDTANPGIQSYSTDYNVYYNITTHADYPAGPTSFVDMQRTYGKDPNSINNSNPQFIDPASGNFRLQNGSPALTRGIDVLDLNRNGNRADVIPAGAFVVGNEIIGLLPGSGDSTPPSSSPAAPRNLRIF